MKALINTGKNPFASELLEEIPDFEVELVSSDTAAGAQGPGTAPEGTEPLSEEAKRLGMLRWCMHHHAGELRMAKWRHRCPTSSSPMIGSVERTLTTRTGPTRRWRRSTWRTTNGSYQLQRGGLSILGPNP